jgi:hypothetical protein
VPYYKLIKDIRDDATEKRVVENLLNLRSKLSDEVPAKTVPETLLLATWNIREFGGN